MMRVIVTSSDRPVTLDVLQRFIDDALKAGFSPDTEVYGPQQMLGIPLLLTRVSVSEEREIPE